MKMKVISTDPGASLPAKDGRAELMNTSLVNISELTVCARFLTHHFSTPPDNYPFQTIISYGQDSLLCSYVGKSCDFFYQGCTENYIEKFEGQQWIRGKVFGNFYISGYNYFYPVWLPAVWNTFCITIRATHQYYRVNITINGHKMVETREIANDFSKSSKGGIFQAEKRYVFQPCVVF